MKQHLQKAAEVAVMQLYIPSIVTANTYGLHPNRHKTACYNVDRKILDSLTTYTRTKSLANGYLLKNITSLTLEGKIGS